MLRTFKWCCDESGRKNQVPFFTPTITSTLSMISALNYAFLGLHIPIPIPMPYPYIRSTDSVGAWFVCIIDAFGCHISLTYLCLRGRSLPMITSICNALLPLIIKIDSPNKKQQWVLGFSWNHSIIYLWVFLGKEHFSFTYSNKFIQIKRYRKIKLLCCWLQLDKQMI